MGEIFRSGSSVFAHPVKLIYLDLGSSTPDVPQLLFGVSVPKRLHPRAHSRNRIKRLIRECYRLSKSSLIQASKEKDRRYALLYLYIAKEEVKYDKLYAQFDILHDKWLSQIEKIDYL